MQVTEIRTHSTDNIVRYACTTKDDNVKSKSLSSINYFFHNTSVTAVITRESTLASLNFEPRECACVCVCVGGAGWCVGVQEKEGVFPGSKLEYYTHFSAQVDAKSCHLVWITNRRWTQARKT